MVSAAALVDLLGPWADGADPLNEQLAAALARAIDLGLLPPGTRLPAERELARELALSRTTIVAAYDRLRLAGGRVEGEEDVVVRAPLRTLHGAVVRERSHVALRAHLVGHSGISARISANARTGPAAGSAGSAANSWLDFRRGGRSVNSRSTAR